MKYIVLLFFFTPTLTWSQRTLENELDTITSVTQAYQFIETHKSSKGKLYTFNKEKHKTKLANELFTMAKGSKKVVKSNFKTTYYKIIDKNEVIHNRVHYIKFLGTDKSLAEINTLRSQIISKFKQGYDFQTLAKYYSMDVNAKKGGDTGWYESNSLDPNFEAAVKSHAQDDIFTLDLPEENEYYVILKSHEPITIDEITVLKFTEPKK